MLRAYSRISRICIILLDQLIVLISFILSFEIRNKLLSIGIDAIGQKMSWADAYPLLLITLITWWILLIIQDAYKTHRFFFLSDELKSIFWVFGVGSIIMAALCFFSRTYFARSLIALFCCISFLLLVLEKLVIFLIVKQHSESAKTNVLVIGTGEKARAFLEEMEKYPLVSYNIIGFLDEKEENIRKTFCGYKIIGTMAELESVLKTYFIEMVFFILPPSLLDKLEEMLRTCEEVGVEAKVFSNFFNLMLARSHSEYIYNHPVISFTTVPYNEVALLVKRLLDIIISAALLLFLAPIFLVFAVIIKRTSPGPVFYPWRVVGKNNRNFVGYKFRTMLNNADKMKEELLKYNEMQGPVFKMKNDPRITSFGKFLRRYSLDELPQLYSVLKGDMSLVGPRPPSREESDRFEFWQRRKMSVKPGMTCLWQVNGRNEITNFTEWANLDLQYIDNWSIWLDLKILYKTFWTVVGGTGM